MIVVVEPEPEVVTAPGDIVMVQVPDEGSPLRGTLPVGTLQVGWVIVPITGVEGVTSCELIVTLADAAEIHPEALVTVKV